MSLKPVSTSTIKPEDRVLGPRCRHFNDRQVIWDSGSACSIGHPIVKIVLAKDPNNDLGLALRLPCQPGPLRAAECPNYDPKTAEEITRAQEALRKEMDNFTTHLPALNVIKQEMIRTGNPNTRTTCPSCKTEDSLKVSVNIRGNKHMWAKCSNCGFGLIE